MDNMKSDFSIKDLENISGIKAHTIRIWEKRYKLLEPERTETNIRHYGLRSLQKLLNVAFLNSNGIKISKIAKLSNEEVSAHVREIASRGNIEHHAINAFKMSMFHFDQVLFYKTYMNLLERYTFREIFYDIFIPLLNEMGLLWQTNTISPAHEHFISVHIKQKILLNIEKLQSLEPKPATRTFVLFLPENEIHDIGLLFVNYELRSRGYHTIFLGESIPMESLSDVLEFFNEITFISYFTVKPIEREDVLIYLDNFKQLLLKKESSKLWLLGHKLGLLQPNDYPKATYGFNSIENLVKEL
ncbi:MAG: MerR family transcriptional regulator [Flavobacteriaceae bacterium]|mgnify:FL=1|jgi:DNA-binding transcriptional MerR regulator|nr:MerR family transcriptional regulator [Flavobacteriaceae bacterium]MCP4803034.1 MerR family transcriptional regulator [Bacteroidota bacterium]MDG2349998.1 MerR family transcriptional regulator [Flavobacteriaceae bacterium]|tara:strand:- start:4165 stop:5067 length:903 start_codon:yes stop_codon:yes gene_type:complete